MGMKLHAVDSSMLVAVGYDEKAHEMRVVFKTGETYAYRNVPQSVYTELLKSESKGAYLKTHVIDVYSYTKVRRP